MLGRDERERFRAIDMETSIGTIEEARKILKAKMAKAIASGDTVFPQGD